MKKTTFIERMKDKLRGEIVKTGFIERMKDKISGEIVKNDLHKAYERQIKRWNSKNSFRKFDKPLDNQESIKP